MFRKFELAPKTQVLHTVQYEMFLKNQLDNVYDILDIEFQNE